MLIHKYSIRFQILYLLIESSTWLQHLIIKYSSLLCNIHEYLFLLFICTTTIFNFYETISQHELIAMFSIITHELVMTFNYHNN